jgi:hypothetical protein
MVTLSVCATLLLLGTFSNVSAHSANSWTARRFNGPEVSDFVQSLDILARETLSINSALDNTTFGFKSLVFAKTILKSFPLTDFALGAFWFGLENLINNLGTGPDDVLQYLQQEIRLLNLKLDDIRFQIGQLTNMLEEVAVKHEYMAEIRKLENVWSKYENFLKTPRKGTLSEARLICQNPYFSPDLVLNWFHSRLVRNVTSPNSPPFIDSLLKITEYDMRALTRWAVQLLVDTTRAIYLRVFCLSLDENWTREEVDLTQEDMLAKLKQINKVLIMMLDKGERNFKSSGQLRLDVFSVYVSGGWSGNEGLASKILEKLTKKYFWLRWCTVVYNAVSGSKMHSLVSRSSSQSMVFPYTNAAKVWYEYRFKDNPVSYRIITFDLFKFLPASYVKWPPQGRNS